MVKANKSRQEVIGAEFHSNECGCARALYSQPIPQGSLAGPLRVHAQRLALAFTASLAFYGIIPWLNLLPSLLAETLILGLWSVPALFFLAALYPIPLFLKLQERFGVLRITVLSVVAFTCSLGSLFLVSRLMLIFSALAGVPLKVG